MIKVVIFEGVAPSYQVVTTEKRASRIHSYINSHFSLKIACKSINNFELEIYKNKGGVVGSLKELHPTLKEIAHNLMG